MVLRFRRWKPAVDSRGTRTPLSVTAFVRQRTPTTKGIVMSLPATVGSVTPAARESAIESLKQLLGDRLSTAASLREQHGKDASYHPCVPPDAVAFAQSTEEVSEIVKVCGRHKVPIIPFGTGTGAHLRFVKISSSKGRRKFCFGS